ncbi:uncharacterized protein LOC126833654 [Adelges cooleyi]|uniref:uncharacterized protein LOC126833654 n=1 Tax=Adelges cooleyi TaxID=133065 RepID=UPI00217F7574|nr:uncharacterized protein LOC126833654 [Adelges cooleyi]
MDIGLTEAMKNIVPKGLSADINSAYSGYVTEKIYMLLQLYLQNKGWNSIELLKIFSEMKDSSVLPSASYLQMMASRVSLDSQARLILRENGKIILPYEHFANAVMLKHMNGPHGLHLGIEGTVRAVMESYTIGRDNFGMEKEFIIEVVQNCPNPACRYYKTQLDLSQHVKQSNYINSASSGVNVPVGRESPNVAMNQMINQQLSAHNLTAPSNAQSQQHSVPVDLTGSSHQSDVQNVLPINIPQTSKTVSVRQAQHNKLADFLKANLENLDNKDLLAAHDTTWPEVSENRKGHLDAGQEKIIRAFSEIMKNMGRMKACVRPAMCKPYGKQSESLQKTLIDTIQLVQSLRSFLPPPHIAVSSWKNEDKHGMRKNVLDNSNQTVSAANFKDLCDAITRNKQN